MITGGQVILVQHTSSFWWPGYYFLIDYCKSFNNNFEVVNKKIFIKASK